MKCSELNTFTCDEISSLTCDQIDSDKQDLLLKIATGEITVPDKVWEKIRILCENSIKMYNAIAPDFQKVTISQKTRLENIRDNMSFVFSSISFIWTLLNPTSTITNYNIENNIYIKNPAPIDEETRNALSHNIDEILDTLEEHKEVL